MSPPKKTSLKKYIYRGDPLSDPAPPELMAILDRHRNKPDALITALEEIQQHYGYLPELPLKYTARELHFPLSRVYGVATFYNLFKLVPPGRYQVRVCKGTACHVGHSDDITTEITARLGISEEETTPDKLFTLQTVACVGACSLAPVVVVNDHTYARMTPQKVWDILAHLIEEISQESGVRIQDSGGGGQEAGVRSQESGVRSQESGVRSQALGGRR